MGGDHTRFTFDPWRDFCGVLMQQGKVQLDADFNELVEIIDRRLRAETLDIIGPSGVPRAAPDGFKVAVTGGLLTIGRGRLYLHGLVVENHGTDPGYDQVLGEMLGQKAVSFTKQPYAWADPSSMMPSSGRHVAYLDVWQREVTAVEIPDLVDRAVGVDTATRSQTAWQVRLMAIDGTVSCANINQGWFAAQAATKPSAGRLSCQTSPGATSSDPCLILPEGGYQGTENRLYRVEIHDGGGVGQATFKWSRDNASVVCAVTAISADRKRLTLAALGRDAQLGLGKGDWVEVIDDRLEWSHLPGVVSRIAEDPDRASNTIVLTTALGAGIFDTASPAARHTRVRRWDQSGKVFDSNLAVYRDLDAATSTGVIKVPAPTTSLVIEDGVQVTFSLATAGGSFCTGDYWIFAARTADRSLEELVTEPPRGILHHYCALAIVNLGSNIVIQTDCRTLWPPTVAAGSSCECTVCVTEDSHATGTLTIQNAIAKVTDTGGTVCLGPGQYFLQEPLRLENLQAVRLVGQGSGSVLDVNHDGAALKISTCSDITISRVAVSSNGTAVEIDGCNGVRVESSFFGPGTQTVAAAKLVVAGSLGITVWRCLVLQAATDAAIGLRGLLVGVALRENTVVGSTAIAVLPESAWTVGLAVEKNHLMSLLAGVDLGLLALHSAETSIVDNTILGPASVAIRALGGVVDTAGVGCRVQISGNLVAPARAGNAIVVGTDETTITGNDLRPAQQESGGHGIVLSPGLLAAPGVSGDDGFINRCVITGNRIKGMGGHGIFFGSGSRVASALVKQNQIAHTGGCGVVMAAQGTSPATATTLHVENNQVLHVGRVGSGETVAGILLVGVDDLVVVSNSIDGVGQGTGGTQRWLGVQLIRCRRLRVALNSVANVLPVTGAVPAVAIEILDRDRSQLETADLSGNVVTQQRTQTGIVQALRVIGSNPQSPPQGSDGPPVLPRGGQRLTVRGNQLAGRGDRSAVEIVVSGPCVFADNQCLLPTNDQHPVVKITSGAAIVSSNYIEGRPSETAVALDLWLDPPLTVVGNIVSGLIHVAGSSLAGSWPQLNVLGS